jgi:1-phosphofructokinase family hexose kinase
LITVAALSPALDMTYVVDDLVLGKPHRPTSVIRVAGGKALNSARAAARLGGSVVAVPVLGGHLGGMVASLLEADGVAASVVAAPEETRICVSIASEAAGSLTEIYEHPVPLAPDVWARALEAISENLTPGSWLSISGGLPPGSGTGLVSLVEIARDRGALVALDTHGAALESVLGSGALSLLKVNREEAAEALGVVVDVADMPLASLVGGLRDRTGSSVVVTDGAAGSLAADASGMWRVTLPPSAAAFGSHPVGSGDSYLGALLAGLDAGASLPDAVALAAGAATANALAPGAAVFDAAVARALAAQVEVVRA